MKPEPHLIADQIYDMLDAWHIATTLDQATDFKKRFPFLANDMVYTYRLSYCALLCKLTDPAVQNGHENLGFDSEIDSMKKGLSKSQAQDLLSKIRQMSAQYRTVRNKIGSHSSRQAMRSRRAIATPTIKKTEQINEMLVNLYELVFKTVFPSPPVQTPNDLSALLSAVQQGGAADALTRATDLERSGDASRHPNGPAAGARGSRREARPEPTAAPDSRCTTSGCSAPAGEPRGR